MKSPCLLCLTLFWAGIVFAQDKPDLPIPQLLQKAQAAGPDTTRLEWKLDAAYAYVLKPGEEKTDLDSAILLTTQVLQANDGNTPRIKALGYFVYSNAWRERGQPDSGKKNVQLAIDLYNKAHDPVGLAYAYLEAANYYDYADRAQVGTKVRYYQLAAPLFEATGRKEMQASTLEIMGDCIGVGHIAGLDPLPPLLQALKLYTSVGHKDLRNLYNLLGEEYSRIGDHERALYYGLLAMRQEETLPESMSLCTSYNRLAIVYYGMNDFQNAESYFKKAAAVAIRFRDTGAIKQTEINYVNSLIQQKKPDSALTALTRITTQYPFTGNQEHLMVVEAYIGIYLQTNRLNAIRPYIDEFVHADAAMDPADFMHVLVTPNLIRYALTTRQYDMARKYADEFETYCKKNGQWVYLYSNYYMQFKADSAQNNYKAAIGEYQKYVVLRDSLLNAANTKQIEAIKLDYETDKKDKDIQLLTRQQELNKAQLRQAGTIRNSIVGGLLMLLILLIVLYNQYRIKKRNNLTLEESNRIKSKLLDEKEWLLKEIHHRVKNNLQIAMSLLNTQSFYLDNEKALAAIRQSRNRMYAMSLIHQRLYQSDNLELIDMSQYVPELIDYIQDSYAVDRRIAFITAIDSIRLDVAQAVPIGLIVNEAVTNSIKYAFPSRIDGTIRVILQRIYDDHLQLEITDDGIGVGDDFDYRLSRSMGMRLIDSLNQQLDGKMTVANKDGLSISINFMLISDHHAMPIL